jgi:hypothetical protein
VWRLLYFLFASANLDRNRRIYLACRKYTLRDSTVFSGCGGNRAGRIRRSLSQTKVTHMLTNKQLQVARLLAEGELHRVMKRQSQSLYAEFLRRLMDTIDREIPSAPSDPEMDMNSIMLTTHKGSPHNGH